MRTCVTGGAGFIGSHLVDRLLSDGHEVVVLDDLSTGSLDNLARRRGEIEFHRTDVRDRLGVAAAVADCDVVFHQAALAAVARSIERPHEVHEVNVTGTLNVLTAARDAGVRRVVFASSSSVYGDTVMLPKHTAMTSSPRSPYAATKAAGESYCLSFHASYGLETVAMRYFNVYGPRQSAKSLYAAVVPLFVDAMASGRAPVIFGDGGQTRDFTYVSDTVDAVVRAATAPEAAGRVFNVGGGERISIADLAEAIAEEVGYTGAVVQEPGRAGDVRHSLADVDDTREVLGWAPLVTLREGIASVAAARAAATPEPAGSGLRTWTA